MATTVGTQNEIDDLVEALLNLEHDALEAYNEVIDRLDNQTFAKQVADFREDHQRHIKELEAFATEIGADHPDGSMKSILTKGKVVMADMAGDDAILKAMATNESDTVSAYERASKQDCCIKNTQLHDICTRAWQDEQRHKSWMEEAAHEIDKAA